MRVASYNVIIAAKVMRRQRGRPVAGSSKDLNTVVSQILFTQSSVITVMNSFIISLKLLSLLLQRIQDVVLHISVTD